MVLALAAFLLSAWALVEPLGNHGLWFAMLLFMAARGLVHLDVEPGAGFDAAPSRPAPARR